MKTKNIARNLFLLLTLLSLSACAMKPPTPEDVGESFVLERDLIGKTIATGSFSAIDGTHREFVAYIDGSWDGTALTLVEDFEYSDGEKERKTWVLTKQSNGEYSGVREDVVGTARGYQDGKAFRMEYTMALPNEDGSPGRKLKFRDVLVNDSQGRIINNATVGLWGFRVATVSLLMEKEKN
ncbi:MAG: DUF3833 family protein [Granulosicoccus sp.]